MSKNIIYIMSKNIILSGCYGFIGHQFAEYIFRNINLNMIIIDKLNKKRLF
jgi:hypothetical protein